ncbi:MAG: hypothetical protein FWC33_01110 [Candidatus Bathyarchaeota archaeon]|nr:hypothetical protein [Candidatus Termiticorpusculum sp.]
MSFKKISLITFFSALIIFSAYALHSIQYVTKYPDILNFHAKVLEFDPNFYHPEALLFVYSITPVGDHNIGGRYFIKQSNSITIMDAFGDSISEHSILPGTIVNITYYGVVHEGDPGTILYPILIQVE